MKDQARRVCGDEARTIPGSELSWERKPQTTGTHSSKAAPILGAHGTPRLPTSAGSVLSLTSATELGSDHLPCRKAPHSRKWGATTFDG